MEKQPQNNSFIKMEEGFLIVLMILAFIGFVWLFSPFMNAILLAVLTATATYPIYKKFRLKLQNISDSLYTLLFCSILIIITVIPLAIFLVELSAQLTDFSLYLATFDVNILNTQINYYINLIPLEETTIQFLRKNLLVLSPEIANSAKNIVLEFATTIFSNAAHLILFFCITIFTLFFLYRDGAAIVKKTIIISPLRDELDHIISHEFATLSSLLTASVIGIAVIQGLIFGVFASFLNLPWLLLGFAVAILSFIPVIGAALVWAPVSMYLLLIDNTSGAITMLLVGTIVNGLIIDNMIRPFLIKKLNSLLSSSSAHSPISYTLITVLSTLAGLINFGIMGLFFGPMIAAMALTIFNVYYIYHTKNIKNPA